jgi:hypothetical protein
MPVHPPVAVLSPGIAPSLVTFFLCIVSSRQPHLATKPTQPSNETILGNPRNHPETDQAYLSGQQAAAKFARRPQMNHSFHSADRSTHLKIVVVALVAGIAVTALGIATRNNSEFTQTAQSPVVKAGKPVAITSSETSAVR